MSILDPYDDVVAIFVGGTKDGQQMLVSDTTRRIKIPVLMHPGPAYIPNPFFNDPRIPRAAYIDEVYERRKDGRFYFVEPADSPVIVEGAG